MTDLEFLVAMARDVEADAARVADRTRYAINVDLAAKMRALRIEAERLARVSEDRRLAETGPDPQGHGVDG